MRKYMFAAAIVILIVLISFGCVRNDVPIENSTSFENATKIEIYLFRGEGCPRCADEEEFLNSIAGKYPIEVKKFEVWYNATNKAMLDRMASSYGINPKGVPVTFIGESSFSGFDTKITGKQIESKIKFCLQFNCSSPSDKIR